MIMDLRSLLGKLNILNTDWDLLMVGDGSGSKWNNPGGWAVSLIMRMRFTGKIVYLSPIVGAVNRGPINWLEAMPYWHGLRHHFFDMKGKEQCASGGVNVHIVTDSEWTVKAMSGETIPDIHADMRCLFQFYEAKGYRLHWYHLPRESTKVNQLMDQLAACAREYIGSLELPRISEEFPTFQTEYMNNPAPPEPKE